MGHFEGGPDRRPVPGAGAGVSPAGLILAGAAPNGAYKRLPEADLGRGGIHFRPGKCNRRVPSKWDISREDLIADLSQALEQV